MIELLKSFGYALAIVGGFIVLAVAMGLAGKALANASPMTVVLVCLSTVVVLFTVIVHMIRKDSPPGQ